MGFMFPDPPHVVSAPGAAKDASFIPTKPLPPRLLPNVPPPKEGPCDARPTEPKGDGAMIPKLDEVVLVLVPSRLLFDEVVKPLAEALSFEDFSAAANPNAGALDVEDAGRELNGEADDFERAAKPDEANAAEDVCDLSSEGASPEGEMGPSETLVSAKALKGDVAKVFVKLLLWMSYRCVSDSAKPIV